MVYISTLFTQGFCFHLKGFRIQICVYKVTKDVMNFHIISSIFFLLERILIRAYKVTKDIMNFHIISSIFFFLLERILIRAYRVTKDAIILKREIALRIVKFPSNFLFSSGRGASFFH